MRLQVKNTWSSGDEHVFDPKRKCESQVNKEENARCSKRRINKEYAQFRDGDTQFRAHSCEDAKPLPFHGMSEIFEHVWIWQ